MTREVEKKEIQNYIIENNIKSPKELKENKKLYYSRYRNHKLDLYFPGYLPRQPKPTEKEVFQKFIDDNEIQNPSDFIKRFGSWYTYLTQSGYAKDMKYPKRGKSYFYEDIDSLEKFQLFVDNNDIKNASDFSNRYPEVFNRLGNLNLKSSIKYSEPLQRSFRYLRTVEDYQQFIDENEIKSPADLDLRFAQVYDDVRRKGLDSFLSFPYRKKSMGEIIISKILSRLEINYVWDKSANFLTTASRLDFRIDQYKLVIEYQGSQHFVTDPTNNWVSAEEQYKLDLVKHDECVRNGWSVIYVAFPERDNRLKKVNFQSMNYIDRLILTENDLYNFLIELKQQYNENNSNLPS